jgi:copper chaperone CopZ
LIGGSHRAIVAQLAVALPIAPYRGTGSTLLDGVHRDRNPRSGELHSAQTLEALLGAEPGVRRATVSFKAHEAQVRFDPNAIDDGEFVAAIERAGHKVVIATP